MAHSKCGYLKYRDCRRVLVHNGFDEQAHAQTSHVKFRRDSETVILSALGVHPMIWRRLCKTHKLNEEV